MTEPRPSLFSSIAADERFRVRTALGPGAFLDAGLPLALFTVVYTAFGRDLMLSLWVAVAAGVVLAVTRLLRRDPLQNVLAGFLGVGIAAFLAARTGRAEDVFLPGLLVNLGYGLAFLVSILVRWPLLGVFAGVVSEQGMSWRDDPDLVRAYTRASGLWVGMFALRLVVQVPLYLAGDEQLGWLAGARLVMSWPLFLLVAYASWLIVRPAYRAHAEQLAHKATP